MKRAATPLGYASVILCLMGAEGLLWVLVGNPPAALRILSLFTVAIGAVLMWIGSGGIQTRRVKRRSANRPFFIDGRGIGHDPLVSPWVWLRMVVGCAALVVIITGPGWLAAAAGVVLTVNLFWVVFTPQGSRSITAMHDAGVLPRRLSLRAIRIFVAVDLALVALFVLAR